MRAPQLIAGLALAAVLVGCSDNDGDKADEPTAGTTTSSGAPEASEAAEEEVSAESVTALIAAAVDVTTVPITEDNDPNDLLGRPNGYVAAIVIKDSRLADCGDDLGVDCGATVEEWPDAEAAKARADYIASLQKDSPMLGSEYHYLDGPVLVRVSGELKPSEAKEYEAVVGE